MRGIMGFACMCLPLAQLSTKYAVSMGPSPARFNSPRGSRNTGGNAFAGKAAVVAQRSLTCQVWVSEFSWEELRSPLGQTAAKCTGC